MKTKIKLTIAVLLFIVAGVLLYSGLTSNPDPNASLRRDVYFFDINREELFAGPSHRVPPFDKGGSGNAVRAYVYKCEDKDRFIGYLEKFAEQSKQKIENAVASGVPDPQTFATMGRIPREHHLVASPEQPDSWYPFDSAEGQKIRDRAYKICPEPEPVTPE